MREYLTVCVIGDTGNGKSSFANLYLQKKAFEASDSVDPVTKEAKAEENYIDGVMRCVIDTEGLNDGQTVSSIQIQNLAKKIRSHKKGINGVAVILNGQNDRFSQTIKDIIKFVYTAFSTKDLLMHLTIVFTRCFAAVPNYPDRGKKRTEYALKVREYLSQISGIKLELIPQIPIFFVDSYDADSPETKENIKLFHGWVASKEPLDTSKFVEAGYREDRIEETRTKYSVGYETRGGSKYQKFEDQKRFKIIPNNGDPIRYTDWVKIRGYEEEIEKTVEETRTRYSVGFETRGRSKYQKFEDQKRSKVISSKGDLIRNSDWVKIREYEEEVERTVSKWQTVDRGHRLSKDGLIRYKVSVEQKREDVVNPITNNIIREGFWHDVQEHLKIDGRKTTNIVGRRQKVTIKEFIIGHDQRFVFFPIYRNYTKYRVEKTIEYQIKEKTTDFDGHVIYHDWTRDFNKEIKRSVTFIEEKGNYETNPKPRTFYI